jgi:hypothetical protein
VTGYGPGYLVPIPAAVVAKASPFGLYYTGLEGLNEAFTRDLGELFEQYVGRHLRLLSDADVHPEVVYIVKGNVKKSVDWIVVFDDLVLLVEVKSVRPTAQLRLGRRTSPGSSAPSSRSRRSSARRSRRPRYPRPSRGSGNWRTPSPSRTPACPRSCSPQASAPGGWSLRGDFAGHDTAGWNPILDQAWAVSPFGKPEGTSLREPASRSRRSFYSGPVDGCARGFDVGDPGLDELLRCTTARTGLLTGPDKEHAETSMLALHLPHLCMSRDQERVNLNFGRRCACTLSRSPVTKGHAEHELITPRCLGPGERARIPG